MTLQLLTAHKAKATAFTEVSPRSWQTTQFQAQNSGNQIHLTVPTPTNFTLSSTVQTQLRDRKDLFEDDTIRSIRHLIFERHCSRLLWIYHSWIPSSPQWLLDFDLSLRNWSQLQNLWIQSVKQKLNSKDFACTKATRLQVLYQIPAASCTHWVGAMAAFWRQA